MAAFSSSLRDHSCTYSGLRSDGNHGGMKPIPVTNAMSSAMAAASAAVSRARVLQAGPPVVWQLTQRVSSIGCTVAANRPFAMSETGISRRRSPVGSEARSTRSATISKVSVTSSEVCTSRAMLIGPTS